MITDCCLLSFTLLFSFQSLLVWIVFQFSGFDIMLDSLKWWKIDKCQYMNVIYSLSSFGPTRVPCYSVEDLFISSTLTSQCPFFWDISCVTSGWRNNSHLLLYYKHWLCLLEHHKHYKHCLCYLNILNIIKIVCAC